MTPIVHTETHLTFSTLTAEQHSSCVLGWACCSLSVLVFVCVACAQTLLSIAQSDTKSAAPSLAVSQLISRCWLTDMLRLTYRNINSEASGIQVKVSSYQRCLWVIKWKLSLYISEARLYSLWKTSALLQQHNQNQNQLGACNETDIHTLLNAFCFSVYILNTFSRQ